MQEDDTCSFVEQPLQAAAFKKVTGRTDKKGFVLYTFSLLFFMPFFIYFYSKYWNVYKVFYHRDNCGNFCGVKNPNVSHISCSGKDYTLQRYLNNGQCVEYCPPNTNAIKASFADSFVCSKNRRDDENLSEQRRKELHSTEIYPASSYAKKSPVEYCLGLWPQFLISTAATIGLCGVILLIFKLKAGLVITLTFLVIFLSLFLMTGMSWLFSFTVFYNGNSYDDYYIIPILSPILLIVSAFTPCVVYNQIKMTTLLYEETGRVIISMYKLLLFTLLMIMIQLAFMTGFVMVTLSILTSTQLSYGEINKLRIFLVTGAVIIANWTMQLFIALQWMIVSDTIAKWYFSENQQDLKSPIWESFIKTVRLHIGTITYGSLFQPWIGFLKRIVSLFIWGQKYESFILDKLIVVAVTLESLSKDAFIESAMHGQPFFASGKRAYSLLIKKAPSVIPINTKGDCVLLFLQISLFLCSQLNSYFIFSYYECELSMLITVLVNVIIVTVFLETFKATAHTLLICACEEKVANEGTSRHYRIPSKLKQFFEKSATLLPQHNSQHYWV